MSADSSEEQKKNGRGNHPNSIAAGTRNLIPYKPGQSGNPGGVGKGAVFITEAYKRLMKLDNAELVNYRPKNAAEIMALRLVAQGAYGCDPLPAIKEIADRTEGKAIQRRVDLTEEDVVSKAKLAYALGLRLRDNLVAHCREIACSDECAERMSMLIPFDNSDVLQAVLSTVDERYHDAVIRELGAMG